MHKNRTFFRLLEKKKKHYPTSPLVLGGGGRAKTQIFEEASFFLSVLSVRVGQTPVTCPIDLDLKRPCAPTQPGLQGSGVGVKTFFHARGVFFCLGSIPSSFRGHKENAALSRVMWARPGG